MQTDIRRSSLNNLQHLLKQLDKLRARESSGGSKQLINSIAAGFDLLHNDLILVLNHNFYLSCKLAEKERALGQLEQRCSYLQEKAQLSLQMAKTKYQKQIRALKYQQYKVSSRGQPDIVKVFDEPVDFDLLQEDLPTPKKILALRETRSALDHRETLQKPKEHFLGHDEDTNNDGEVAEVPFEGVFSEQISKKGGERGKETSKSEAEEEKYRRSWEKGEDGQLLDRDGEGGKKGELAKLVSQHYRVAPLKEKYFSTDLL